MKLPIAGRQTFGHLVSLFAAVLWWLLLSILFNVIEALQVLVWPLLHGLLPTAVAAIVTFLVDASLFALLGYYCYRVEAGVAQQSIPELSMALAGLFIALGYPMFFVVLPREATGSFLYFILPILLVGSSVFGAYYARLTKNGISHRRQRKDANRAEVHGCD